MIAKLRHLSHAGRVRRNHALEHATITVVSEVRPSVNLRGRSNRKGFYINGEIDTATLHASIEEAARRLRRGEKELALHPRCGTNLAVAGLLSGLAAALASQLKPRQSRYSYAVLAAIGALMVAPPLGENAQRYLTTEADLGDLQVVGVERRRFLGETVHWVSTRSSE